MKKTFSFLYIIVLISNHLFAQNNFLIIDKETNLLYESQVINESDTFHSAIYPRTITSITNYDSVQQSFQTNSKGFSNYIHNKNPNSFFNQTSKIIPLINLELSKDFSGQKSPYTVGAGLLLQSNFGKKVSFEFSVYGAQQRFGIDSKKQIDSTKILPHIGEYNAQVNGAYVYTNWEGYISYKPYKFLNFQIGKDQNFFGDGQRSLLLSGNSSPYKFVKAIVSVGKIKYVVLYQFMKDIDTGIEKTPNELKFSTTHFLSWNLGKRFNINLFETVIWRDKLEDGVHRGYDFNYMNPIIFLRPVEYSIGSADNVIMGGGFRLRLFKKTNIYGQLVLDEFKLAELKANTGWWANKYGYQLGVKIYDLFKIKNLFVLGEYNYVRPFTYSHWTSMENYGNMYEPLAHPLGANFKEIIGLLNYRKNRWQFQARFSLAKLGVDIASDSTNYGQNIYRSYRDNVNEYGNYTLQGELTQIQSSELKLGYIINPLWNFRIEAGLRVYSYTNSVEELKQQMFFIALKTLF